MRIWDLATGSTERTLKGHTGWVRGVCAVRVQGRELLASVGVDRTVRIWDPSTGHPRHVIPIHYGAHALAWFNAGCLVVGNSAGLLAPGCWP